MKNNTKKDIINALKYIATKAGIGFCLMGFALLVCQPEKTTDLLFSKEGIGIWAATISGIIFYILGENFGNVRLVKVIEKLKADNDKLRAENETLRTAVANMKCHINGTPHNKQPKVFQKASPAVSETVAIQPKTVFDYDAMNEDSSDEEVAPAIEEMTPAEQPLEAASTDDVDLQVNPSTDS